MEEFALFGVGQHKLQQEADAQLAQERVHAVAVLYAGHLVSEDVGEGVGVGAEMPRSPS